MWDLTLELEELRDELAETQRKIWVLEQTGRELMAIVDRSGEPEIDPLIRRHLDEVAMRMAIALVRPTSIAGIME
jgi:type II secretory pathway predicted ATPase ExeA